MHIHIFEYKDTLENIESSLDTKTFYLYQCKCLNAKVYEKDHGEIS
jgi:hypothetical protein